MHLTAEERQPQNQTSKLLEAARYSNPRHHSVFKLRADAKTKYIAEIEKSVFSRSRIAVKPSITLIPTNSDNSESMLHFQSIKFTDWMKVVEVKSRKKN